MKFSIVVPVYNVERYIDRCLNSIIEQTYKDFEVIIVNDETPDNSQNIIDKYTKKDSRFKSYSKKNGGLSDARNFGVKYTTGDYLLFIDSDDYIEKDLLLKLNECTGKNDIIRYKINVVDENGNLIKKTNGPDKSGNITFSQLVNDVEIFQTAWSYAYNMNFWKKNNFQYEKGRIHEDFGLTPLCTILAQNIYFLNYYGYNYVQREGSIMNGSEKNTKRVYDTLYHFDNLIEQIKSKDVNEIDRKIYESYLANNTISIAKILNGKQLNEYIKCLNDRKMYKYLLDNTISRKLKKILVRTNLNLYIRLMSK